MLDFGRKVAARQAPSSQNRSSLLDDAILRFNPQVFSHPVWIRFGKQETPVALNLIRDLSSAADNLREDDPSAACQVLLICAVYQNYVGQTYQASRTTQQAVRLAERASLTRERIWGMWGACALSVQQGNYEKAADNLIDLQAILREQEDWILAGFVDVLRQALAQQAVVAERPSGSLPGNAVEDMLTFTLDWLQHWGCSAWDLDSEVQLPPAGLANLATKPSLLMQSFSPVQRWQGRWRSFMLAIRGELRLQWADSNAQVRQKGFSFWASVRSFLRLNLPEQELNVQIPKDIPRLPDRSTVPPGTEIPSKSASLRSKPTSRTKKSNVRQPSRPATTIIPVAVHLLGAFSLRIGDLTVRLPGSRALSLFKYLLLHHRTHTRREVLMDIFWPDMEPETARNNLNVAIHSLRKALRTAIFLPVIVFEDGAYGLESNMQVWLDVEEFERCVKSGQRFESRDQLTDAVAAYETAVSIYQGDLLEQNPYEEWTVLDRERLRIAYLDTLDRLSQIYFSQERYAACITVCQLILVRDRCREDAHCLLMRCYSRQGQHHLAVRQYQVCAEALHSELQVEPAPETAQLYRRIRRREQV
jgi:DNA-binding SARP family transcriptional activator